MSCSEEASWGGCCVEKLKKGEFALTDFIFSQGLVDD
jgi:hypothetical protein